MQGIGRYKILRSLGRGGMAEVLEGIAVGEGGFERRVAIKRMLADHGSNDAFVKMFVDEANIAARLHHGNIAAVLDYGVADGLPFQVLEFVDGADARTLLELGATHGEQMPVEVALYVCTEVAHALACAHDARDANGDALGVVHRDVSPGNILVSWGGDVKLTDFGIAFSKARSAERTTAGITKGTPPYMSPEQMLGGDVDGRTDVFALGCVLHTLLTGKSPLSHEPNIVSLLSGAAMELSPTLPEDVDEIVRRATRYRKSERYPTAAAMGAALGEALYARIDRDAKSVMVEWLTRIRPRAPEATRSGRLDALLYPELVLAATEESESVRRFEGRTSVKTRTTVTDVLRTSSAPPASPSITEPPPSPSAPPPRARERGRARAPGDDGAGDADPDLGGDTTNAAMARVRPPRWPLAAAAAAGLLALAIVIGGVWYVRMRGSPARATPPAAAPTSSEAALAPAIPPPPRDPVSPAPSAAPIDRHTTRPHLGAPSASPAPPAPPALAHDPAPPPGPSGAPNVAPPADDSTGVLVVGGRDVYNAEILLDGQKRGYAPREFELPVGTHTVELVLKDGRHFGPHTILLTARNTSAAPLRISR